MHPLRYRLVMLIFYAVTILVALLNIYFGVAHILHPRTIPLVSFWVTLPATASLVWLIWRSYWSHGKP